MQRPARFRRINRQPPPALTDLPYWLLHEIITHLPHCIVYDDFSVRLRPCFHNSAPFFQDSSYPQSRSSLSQFRTKEVLVDFCPLCHQLERRGPPVSVLIQPWPRLHWTNPRDPPPRAYLRAVYGYFRRDITRRMFLIVTNFEHSNGDPRVFLKYLPATGRGQALSTLRVRQTEDLTRQDVQDFYHEMWPGDESAPSFDDQMAEIDALLDGGHFRGRTFDAERMPSRISNIRVKRLNLQIGDDLYFANDDGTLLRKFVEWARRCEWSDVESIRVLAGCIRGEDNFGSIYHTVHPNNYHDSLRAFCGMFSESVRLLRIGQWEPLEGKRTRLDLTPFQRLEKLNSEVVECDFTEVFPLSLREIGLPKISTVLFERLALVTELRVLDFHHLGPDSINVGPRLTDMLRHALEQMRNLHTVNAELPFPLEEWSAAGVSFPSVKRCLNYEGAYWASATEEEIVGNLLALEAVFPSIEDLDLIPSPGFPTTFFHCLSRLRHLRKLTISNPIRIGFLVAVLVGQDGVVEPSPLRYLDCCLAVHDRTVVSATRIFRSLRLHPAVGVEICRFRLCGSGNFAGGRLPIRDYVNFIASLMSIPSIQSLAISGLFGLFRTLPMRQEMEILLFRRPEAISFFSRPGVDLRIEELVYGGLLNDVWEEGPEDPLWRMIREAVM